MDGFIKSGDARVDYELLDVRQVSGLPGDDNGCNVDVQVKTLNRMLYGIPLGNVVVMDVTGRPQRLLDGVAVIRTIKSLLVSDNAFYDAATGFFTGQASRMCISARRLFDRIGDEMMEAAVSKLCPDASDEYRRAVVRNLRNCNDMLSTFRQPVCFIRCNEAVAEKFESLFG